MEKIYTIEDLRQGKVAVEHDGTRLQLNDVLQAAFPNAHTAYGTSRYYFKRPGFKEWTDRIDIPDIPVQSTTLFLTAGLAIENSKNQEK